ncbi:hypothetical protein [Thermogemmata fonticola]|uniref:Uncharacterized protein n=1 Tax=Thermogemmata fonticola TaxID=2755323 RepID=A0A7V8VEI2_9BACT|nr:hypothetical protein [Thermogemmata fonticola]MBA2226575.1 hypothetical protein [Thermogemmata fonticola]
MFQYYKQTLSDFTNWNYIDITLEAYDKLENLLEEVKNTYIEYPTIARGKIIKCRLIIMTLAYTLNNTATNNIMSNRLKLIYSIINNKLEMCDIKQIDIIIRSIQILRESITKLKANSINNNIDIDVQAFQSTEFEA